MEWHAVVIVMDRESNDNSASAASWSWPRCRGSRRLRDESGNSRLRCAARGVGWEDLIDPCERQGPGASGRTAGRHGTSWAGAAALRGDPEDAGAASAAVGVWASGVAARARASALAAARSGAFGTSTPIAVPMPTGRGSGRPAARVVHFHYVVIDSVFDAAAAGGIISRAATDSTLNSATHRAISIAASSLSEWTKRKHIYTASLFLRQLKFNALALR